MPSSSRFLRNIMIGVCAGCVPTFGQSVISGSFPSAWGPKVVPPPQHFFGPEYDGVSGISGDVVDHAGGTAFGGSGLIQLRTKGTVINTLPPDAPPDAFRWQISREQSFTLNEPANVVTPSFLAGVVTLGGAAAANLALVDARVEIYDSANASQGAVAQGMSRFGFSDGIGSSPINTFDYMPVALPAGTYRVRATLEIAGEGGNISSPPGATAQAQFFDNPMQGLETSTAAYPSGLASSRDAVRAPLARTTFGVDGTGVQVGLVETGNPYTTHSALAGGGKLTIITGANPGDFRREHALATAGIIAGVDASNANAGVAPAATILSSPMNSHPGGFQDSVGSLLAANPAMRVMSMSATSGGGAGDTTFINMTINGNPNLTFVKSAGNSGTAGSVTVPGMAHNIITVGAVNRSFTARADFSSYGAAAGTPMKPDLVAPGEYINAPQALDTNGDTMVNDFGRVFLGDDFRYTIAQMGGGANTGDITGTSFAAPHVAGAAALMHQYQMANAATHEADHRVIKAILLNTASTTVKRFGGGAWSQTTTGSLPGLNVTRSLDEELGAGMLDTFKAMQHYVPDEINLPDANTNPNFNIDATINMGALWDLEQVVAGGRVNYLLGDITGQHLRSTLTWDTDIVGGTGLAPLELRFYAESMMVGNPAGYDIADLLLISTPTAGENVKLIDFASVLDLAGSGQYYMQVYNGGAVNTTFGIAIEVPDPACAAAAIAILLIRRRTRAQAT